MPRGRKKQAKALRDEYTRTIEPARALAAETLTLERTLSALVNQAYALTPAEIALMWKTAPPHAHPATRKRDLKTVKNYLLTPGLALGKIAPCLLRPKTQFSLTAQRSVNASAQNANSYH
jgi:hypothetical protein